MIKRVFKIIAFPFYFIYLIVSFPFKVIQIILNDKKGKAIPKKERLTERNLIPDDGLGLIHAGQILFTNHKTEFEKFFSSFLMDKISFLSENDELLADNDNFDLDNLRAIEVIYIFGDNKRLLWITDWKGEENDREIEKFLETKLQIKTDWTNVNNLRDGVDEEKQRDGKFIVDLLKSIDKALEPINKKMIFLDLGWDAYVYTVVDQTSYKTITGKFGTLFHGTEKLRK